MNDTSDSAIGPTLQDALIRLNNLGDLGMSEMIGLMRLHVQEVIRFTALVATHLALSASQVGQFEHDCRLDELDPEPFLVRDDDDDDDGASAGAGARLSDTGVFLLSVAAKVHDIGKPFFRKIYSQHRRLAREEFERQKFHANLGRLIIDSWGYSRWIPTNS